MPQQRGGIFDRLAATHTAASQARKPRGGDEGEPGSVGARPPRTASHASHGGGSSVSQGSRPKYVANTNPKPIPLRGRGLRERRTSGSFDVTRRSPKGGLDSVKAAADRVARELAEPPLASTTQLHASLPPGVGLPPGPDANGASRHDAAALASGSGSAPSSLPELEEEWWSRPSTADPESEAAVTAAAGAWIASRSESPRPEDPDELARRRSRPSALSDVFSSPMGSPIARAMRCSIATPVGSTPTASDRGDTNWMLMRQLEDTRNRLIELEEEQRQLIDSNIGTLGRAANPTCSTRASCTPSGSPGSPEVLGSPGVHRAGHRLGQSIWNWRISAEQEAENRSLREAIAIAQARNGELAARREAVETRSRLLEAENQRVAAALREQRGDISGAVAGAVGDGAHCRGKAFAFVPTSTSQEITGGAHKEEAVKRLLSANEHVERQLEHLLARNPRLQGVLAQRTNDGCAASPVQAKGEKGLSRLAGDDAAAGATESSPLAIGRRNSLPSTTMLMAVKDEDEDS